ncbi:MAG TPA: DUF362 domain-containing protein [Bryobacteraceae bacterium]|nr:DUF362 domain-containing protein [Bryobacteraceae bacterium]
MNYFKGVTMQADERTDRRCTRRRVLHAGAGALAAAGASPLLTRAALWAAAPDRETTDDPPFRTPSEPANSPIGVGQGIHPGRVAWVHEPKAATWDGKTGNWWDDGNTDPRLVDGMVSAGLRSLAGERNDEAAWKALFQFFHHSRELPGAGYRPGEKIAIKLNANQDRPGAWRFGAGMPSPQVVYSLVHQLITAGGVRGQDITLYDASRYIGDPIYNRIRANPDPNFQAVRFVVSQRMAGGGRVAAAPDKAAPVRFSRSGVPTALLPDCVTEASYVINVALSRAHGLMGVTQTAKNQFGSVYFEGVGFTPRPLHDFASRDLPMGSYNCLVDLIAHKHLGGKTMLYLIDFLYVAESQNERVIKYASFQDHWCSSLFVSQDPVAIDSVGLDFIRSEPRALECRGNPENYLHEAALAGKAPSGTVYDPDRDGAPAESLGVHEHWNNATDRKYSRNLGKREGIELVGGLQA